MEFIGKANVPQRIESLLEECQATLPGWKCRDNGKTGRRRAHSKQRVMCDSPDGRQIVVWWFFAKNPRKIYGLSTYQAYFEVINMAVSREWAADDETFGQGLDLQTAIQRLFEKLDWDPSE